MSIQAMRIKFKEEIELLKKKTQCEIKLEMKNSTNERECSRKVH